jgi:hypothetical protein
MRSAIPRWPTPTPTCDAIHGMRAAKLPVTHPCTANTAAVPRRARWTAGAGATWSGADVTAAVTARDYPAPAENSLFASSTDLPAGAAAAIRALVANGNVTATGCVARQELLVSPPPERDTKTPPSLRARGRSEGFPFLRP